ncbi:MAG: AzlD domain-containing protein [Clostridiaceae bacterium]|nr:AzlD domain-containing protein [Clostridiaceae bacterium]
MMLTPLETILTLAVITAGTMATRFLPFLIFPENKPVPKIVAYLGRTLPCAMAGFLVVYCLKNVSVLQAPFGLPETAALICIIALHLWKHNALLSIGVGTAVYCLIIGIL